jgi:hypothetical protein
MYIQRYILELPIFIVKGGHYTGEHITDLLSILRFKPIRPHCKCFMPCEEHSQYYVCGIKNNWNNLNKYW